MALDFTNASLLGYNVSSEFLGETGPNHRNVTSISIEGFIDEGKEEDNWDGVSENFAKIREQIANMDDYWSSNIIINGKSFGKGRVLSLSFDSSPGTLTDQIRIGQYTASIEIYRMGDYTYDAWMPHSSMAYVQYINSWSESVDISKQSDGQMNGSVTLSLDLLSGYYDNSAETPVNIAKNIAAQRIGNDQFPITFDQEVMVETFGDETILRAGVGQNFTESYDLINLNFNFSKRWSVMTEGNVPNEKSNHPNPDGHDYSAKTSRTIQSNDGIISVSERGDVESFAGDWFDMTGGMQVAIDTAYARCSTLFLDTMGQMNSSDYYPLNNTAISISRQFDSGAGAGSYNIAFTNKSGQYPFYSYEYSQSISRSSAGVSTISENGTINSTVFKNPIWTADTRGGYAYVPLTVLGTARTDSITHANELYVNFKGRLNEPVGVVKIENDRFTFPIYGKSFNYNRTFTDDPTIYQAGHPSKLRKIEVNINDVAPMPIIKPYVIPNRGVRGELIHEPGQTSAGSRTISISATKARECGYSHLTGNAARYMADWTTPADWMINKVLVPEVLKSPAQINSYIFDMYIDNLSMSMGSAGDMSVTADVTYTAARHQPAGNIFNANSSNYNV